MEEHRPADRPDIVQWLGDTWAACLAQVIEAMTGEHAAVECRLRAEDSGPPVLAGTALLWEQGFDLAAGAAAWAWLPEETWNSIGARGLRAAGADEVPPEETRGTCLEMLSQSFSLLAQSLGERRKRPVATHSGREVETVPGAATWLEVGLRYEDVSLPPLQLAIAPALAEALEEPAPDQAQAATPQEAPPDAGVPRPEQVSATLDLLRDVELPVSVSFGRARMPLRDVLKLTAGSVIELDRSINDPVALIVNETVVALGDVVVVDGNYGLRIQRILSRDKLLRSSGAA
jgi:flagellar motor switch protein FliN/FliY